MYIIAYIDTPLGCWNVFSYVFPTKDDARAFLELGEFEASPSRDNPLSKEVEGGMQRMAVITKVEVWEKEIWEKENSK